MKKAINMNVLTEKNIGYIDINYISPISKYTFDTKNKKYHIIFLSTIESNSIVIHKVELKNIDNVTGSIRSYGINASIALTPSMLYSTFEILLFQQDLKSDIIELIFVGTIDINNVDYNNKDVFTLKKPFSVMNELRHGKYIDDTSYLSEQFFNYESYDVDNKCLLFTTKKFKTDKPIIKPFIYKFDLSTDNTFVFNRYHQQVIKEIMPSFTQNDYNKSISNYCKNNTYDDYLKLIKEYQIDINKYTNVNINDQKNFKLLLNRKINLQYRPIKYDLYMNNTLTNPTDGRIRGFYVDKSLNFNLYGVKYNLDELITKPYELTDHDIDTVESEMNVKVRQRVHILSSGFISRIIPSDYQRVHLPYGGHLKEVSISDSSQNKPYIMSLKFECRYFIPPSVTERDLLSAIYGYDVSVTRAYPELAYKQPDTTLIYYLILVGTSEDSIIFTNGKLKNMKDIVQKNTNYRIKPLWLEQGEEIATFNCCAGYSIFLVNTKIEFTEDISYYSKVNDNTLYKPIDTYVKLNDVVGRLM